MPPKSTDIFGYRSVQIGSLDNAPTNMPNDWHILAGSARKKHQISKKVYREIYNEPVTEIDSRN